MSLIQFPNVMPMRANIGRRPFIYRGVTFAVLTTVDVLPEGQVHVDFLYEYRDPVTDEVHLWNGPSAWETEGAYHDAKVDHFVLGTRLSDEFYRELADLLDSIIDELDLPATEGSV